MNARKSWLAGLLLVALLVSACGAAAPAPIAEPTMEQESGSAEQDSAKSDVMSADEDMSGDESMSGDEDMDKDMDEDMSADKDMDEDMPAGESMDKDMDDASMDKDEEMADEAMADLPAWFSAQLTDVNSGETLSVADLAGKVVLVETMAIWCSNCLRQQQEVKALHEALGERDDLVTLVLDIDANEAADDLQAYTARHGFPWAYAIAPREVAREIGLLYGDQFLNPPSTPMLIVDRHGEVHPLPFGRKSAADLEAALAPFLDGDM